MGQQQLLLIILGVIIVGIAVAVGITMFQDNALSASRDAITADLVNLASKAQQYYRKPASLGGGGNSFAGITAVTVIVGANVATNDNATYTISTTGSSTITFLGVGKTEISAGSFPSHQVVVLPSSYTVSQLN
jgi:Tfp pilus assembly protein PilE